MSVTPVATMTVIAGTLVAQISMLLAYFLPLKVIILLGSDGIPHYFPPSYMEIGKNRLIILLSMATVVFYLMYQLFEYVTKLASDYGAKKILLRSRKLNLFENQDTAAISGYLRYSSSLAAGVFVIISMMVLLWLYPGLLAVVLAYMLAAFVILMVIYRYSERANIAIHTNPGSIIDVLASIGFLSGFAYIVMDFLIDSPPGFIPAIVSLLLLRQAAQRISSLVTDLNRLYGQRVWLNALFFHNQVMLPAALHSDEGVWPLLNYDQRSLWIPRILQSVGIELAGRITSRWHQSNQLNVIALDVRDITTPHTDGYLVVIFSEGRSVLALHEADLVGNHEIDTGLPSLELLGITELESYRCHIYRLPATATIITAPSKVREAVWMVRKRLLAIDPPDTLAQRYIRSRPCLWQRLDDNMVERLHVAVNEEAETGYLTSLSHIFGDIQMQLRSLPLVIINPVLHPGSLVQFESGDIAAIHWGNWSLDPAGASWPVTQADINRYQDILESARRRRSVLKSISVEHLLLAALMDSFDKSYQRQNYSECLKLVPRILECYEQISNNGQEDVRPAVLGS
jgi:hypothetical protein